MKLRTFFMTLLLLLCTQLAWAGHSLDAVYPYNLDKRDEHVVHSGSTMPLYINITNFDVSHEQRARLKVILPEGFSALPNAKWQMSEENGQQVALADWTLPADFGHSFDLLYLHADAAGAGEKQLTFYVQGEGWEETKKIPFTYDAQEVTAQEAAVVGKKKKPDASRFNWYIQSVTLPVDNQGNKDDRAAEGVIYVRDTTLEGFRNRVMGDGATNWSAVFNHPAAFLLLDMRNPQRDVRLLKFKAELVDKATGKLVPGLCTAGKNDNDSDHGWAGETGSKNETTALISLDGQKSQTFIIPLYVDYFTILAGDYSLRVTVSGNGQEKVQEVPLTITKKHNLGLVAVGFSFLCLAALVVFSYKLKGCIYKIGAKGAITVALFAALSFGGITLPTTLLGDLLHVFLGPFSGLFTGVLSGVLQYLLVVSLLVLFRAPGVLSLMYLVKYMLSGLMFGHFTPLGLLSLCVNIVILEAVLYFSGFYRKKELGKRYLLLVSVLLGVGDALITFINMQQMMFFYRLYYADWYLALYMLVNGVLYSSIGAWLGAKTGSKLQQVMGE